MNSLEKIAKRISEISDEISQLKSQRETNLEKCHGSEDDDFQEDWMKRIESGEFQLTNCLKACYLEVKVSGGVNGFDFDEAIHMYGCKNCIGAYEAKSKIGLLKQERGRLVGNITKIGRKI
jgi:uncharacterized small protein (DUF1192 family)